MIYSTLNQWLLGLTRLIPDATALIFLCLVRICLNEFTYSVLLLPYLQIVQPNRHKSNNHFSISLCEFVTQRQEVGDKEQMVSKAFSSSFWGGCLWSPVIIRKHSGRHDYNSVNEKWSNWEIVSQLQRNNADRDEICVFHARMSDVCGLQRGSSPHNDRSPQSSESGCWFSAPRSCCLRKNRWSHVQHSSRG